MMIKYVILSYEWVYYIPTPSFKSYFMMACHPLTMIHVQKNEERGKTTWGKSSLKKGQGTRFEIICLQHIFIFT